MGRSKPSHSPATEPQHELARGDNALPQDLRSLAEKLGVAESDMPQLEEHSSVIFGMRRRRAEDVFEFGKHLVAISLMFPDQNFDRWVPVAYDMSGKHAGNFIRVYETLGRHRTAMVRARLVASALFTLAGQPDDKVEAVLAVFESGRRLTVEQIKAMLRDEDEPAEPEVNMADIGGTAGITGLAKARLKTGTSALMGRLNEIIADIEEALEPLSRGKRVMMGALADIIETKVRYARGELAGLILPVVPDLKGSRGNVYQVPLPVGTGWRSIMEILYKLGGRESWVKGHDLGPWLRDEVIPALRWAVGASGGHLPKIERKRVVIEQEVPIDPRIDDVASLDADAAGVVEPDATRAQTEVAAAPEPDATPVPDTANLAEDANTPPSPARRRQRKTAAAANG